jgi:type I restriction enzyme S subunit
MGKLVPQDPKDEPALVLLERIKEEKARLVKEGKIKKSEKLPPIEASEIPYELPDSWQWVRLGTLIESMTNGLYKPATYYSERGTGCVRMFNIQDGQLNLTELKRLIVNEKELEQYKLISGDLIVNRVNSRELVGKAAVVYELHEPLVFEAMNIRVRFIQKNYIPEYINVLFRTERIRTLFQGDAKQASGQASISQPQVANILVPLPPLVEQKHMIAKVDHLMSLCDELEAKLMQSISDTEKLMEIAVRQVLAA